jgi:hypothetical protein
MYFYSSVIFVVVVAIAVQVMLMGREEGEERGETVETVAPPVSTPPRQCSLITLLLSHAPDASSALASIRSTKGGLGGSEGGLSCVVVGDTSEGPAMLWHHWTNDSHTLFLDADAMPTSTTLSIADLLAPLNSTAGEWSTLVYLTPLPFTDFAASRNALAAAIPPFIVDATPPTTPVLLLDSGDELTVHDASLLQRELERGWEEARGESGGAPLPASLVCQRWHHSGTRYSEYYNLRLLPFVSLSYYEYKGAVHEYLTTKADAPPSLSLSLSLSCAALSVDQDRDVHGTTSTARWARDARILGRERERERETRGEGLARATFYHAQTLLSLGCRRAATDAFLARIALGGYADEVTASWLSLSLLDAERWGREALRETGRAEVAVALAAGAAERGEWGECGRWIERVREGEATLPRGPDEYGLFVDVTSVSHDVEALDAVCRGNLTAASLSLSAAPSSAAWWSNCVTAHRLSTLSPPPSLSPSPPPSLSLSLSLSHPDCVAPRADGLVHWETGSWSPTRGFLSRPPLTTDGSLTTDAWYLQAIGGDAFTLSHSLSGCFLTKTGECHVSNVGDPAVWFAKRERDGALISMQDFSVLLPFWPLSYSLSHSGPAFAEPAELSGVRRVREREGRRWLEERDTSLSTSLGVPSLCGA